MVVKIGGFRKKTRHNYIVLIKDGHVEKKLIVHPVHLTRVTALKMKVGEKNDKA